MTTPTPLVKPGPIKWATSTQLVIISGISYNKTRETGLFIGCNEWTTEAQEWAFHRMQSLAAAPRTLLLRESE